VGGPAFEGRIPGMADLQEDTEVRGANGRYRAILSPAWEGLAGTPAGGYLAALALRAAEAEAQMPRPVSLHCQFLKPPRSGDEVQLAVKTLRVTKRTRALRVSLVHSSETVVEALVWTADSDLPGYDFDASPPPTSASPQDWQSVEGRTDQPLPVCMQQMEMRWNHADPGTPGAHPEPYTYAWHRLRPKERYGKPFVDASRLVVFADLRAFGPVAYHAGVAPARVPYYAPNMDLTVQFCRDASDCGWVFGAAHALSASGGTITTRIELWSEQRALLAVASSTLMWAPHPFHKSSAVGPSHGG
jgi:acyl-CoA thioesterase II